MTHIKATLAPIGLALALGALAGAVFDVLHVPLAWMLGPLTINIFAAVRGWPVRVPNGVRIVVLAVVGVFLGGSFSPELLQRAGAWIGSLSLMLVFIPLVTLCAATYFRRAAGFDLPTAIFAGAPGTLTAMVTIGGESGADENMIALTQGLRVVMVVVIMPNLISVLIGHPLQPVGVIETAAFLPRDAGLLTATAVFGYGLAHLLRLPAAAMTSSMLVAAALYLSAAVSWRPPEAALSVALWVLGSSIGSRFSAVPAATFFRVGKHAVVATGVVMLVSAGFAGIASVLTGTRYLTALIAFTPGGVAEMCLIAIAFDVDPAFVAMHHLARIALLITAVPIAARILFPRPTP